MTAHELIRYIAAADVLGLPSHGEGLPTVLVEARSVGLRVIVKAVGGFRELFREDRGTLLSNISTASVAHALRSFADDPAEADDAATRLRAFVPRDHDMPVDARRPESQYRTPATSGDPA